MIDRETAMQAIKEAEDSIVFDLRKPRRYLHVSLEATQALINRAQNEVYESLPPQSPIPLSSAELKIFKLGWLECEAAHRALKQEPPK